VFSRRQEFKQFDDSLEYDMAIGVMATENPVLSKLSCMQALVKVRVCRSCAKKLYWKKEKQLKELRKLLDAEVRAGNSYVPHRERSLGVLLLLKQP
jgi:hypothetical protein